MYQTVIPAGAVQPHWQYIVTLDVANRDVTDNGNLPNNDMDPFISVRGFFTLGDDLVDFSQHVGTAYEVPQLSTIAEGKWRQNNIFFARHQSAFARATCRIAQRGASGNIDDDLESRASRFR